MDLVAFHPVFVFLCLLQAALAYVEPPNNVTFHCHNMRNILRWSYEKPSPGLRFKIKIGATSSLNGNPGELWVDPPAPLEADLSFLSDITNEYVVTVTAVIGQNESKSAPEDEIIFSYFTESIFRNHKCFVDFPPVNVTAKEDGIVLYSFTHPWLAYFQNLPLRPKGKQRKKKRHDEDIDELPIFYYYVVKNKQEHGKRDCVTSVCEGMLAEDPAQKKHCLRFKGELEKISVHSTQEYCAPPTEKPDYHTLYYVLASLLALSVLALVLFMLYRKMTSPSTSSPSSMTFTNKVKQWTSRDVPEPVFIPEVSPASPTPLLDDRDVHTFTPTENELRLPIGLPTEGEGVSDVEVGKYEGSGYMGGRSFEEDEELNSEEGPSGYEKRQVVVELAPDEQAEGYRG
ncbi:interferon gamma receptor 1-like [Centropristis striata]|uniref:interferon gamma receptor 1-like n=1 Tax=Centropristis striata TaxID=184440 RepID=UPI0027E0AE8D|nr:interferon gamma receptor 1-like [Centropristis striata]